MLHDLEIWFFNKDPGLYADKFDLLLKKFPVGRKKVSRYVPEHGDPDPIDSPSALSVKVMIKRFLALAPQQTNQQPRSLRKC